MGLREDYTDFTLVDEEGKIEYFYIPIADYYDLRPEELIGTSFQQQYKNLDYEDSTIVKAVTQGVSTINYEEELVTLKGAKVRQVADTYVIKNKDKVVGALEMAHYDSSFSKESQDKLTNYDNLINSTKKLSLEDLICVSDEMVEIKRKINKIIDLESPILLAGEDGTGKETVARIIHDSSKRSKGNFVYVNCAAIPASLIEGILFGTEKGSFTDATEKQGLFLTAHKGTLFLDEINSMPLELQGKILRAIEEKRIRPIGAEKEVPIDTRIIASCNELVQDIIDDKHLRKDLYFRLAIIQLELPALRNRKEDIPALVDYYLNMIDSNISMDQEAFEFMVNYKWPGNVRQLKNTMEGLALAAEGNQITISDVKERFFQIGESKDKETESINQFFVGKKGLKEYVNDYAKSYIKQVLDSNHGDLKKTAGTLGLTNQMLNYNLEKYGLK